MWLPCSLRLAAASRHLIVDCASLAALDIFKEEAHPSAMGIGSSKEGVSVYGLLQRCVTGMVRPARLCCIAALLLKGVPLHGQRFFCCV